MTTDPAAEALAWRWKPRAEITEQILPIELRSSHDLPGVLNHTLSIMANRFARGLVKDPQHRSLITSQQTRIKIVLEAQVPVNPEPAQAPASADAVTAEMVEAACKQRYGSPWLSWSTSKRESLTGETRAMLAAALCATRAGA